MMDEMRDARLRRAVHQFVAVENAQRTLTRRRKALAVDVTALSQDLYERYVKETEDWIKTHPAPR